VEIVVNIKQTASQSLIHFCVSEVQPPSFFWVFMCLYIYT